MEALESLCATEEGWKGRGTPRLKISDILYSLVPSVGVAPQYCLLTVTFSSMPGNECDFYPLNIG